MYRSYSCLLLLESFEDRFDYLKLNGSVANTTFGGKRYVNQDFYRSKEWKNFRDSIIVRDNGCDLGVEDRPIFGKIIIHHLNPIAIEDFSDDLKKLMDPENVVCVSHNTHEAIHYSDSSLLIPSEPIIRKPNDTCLWRK